MVQEQNEIIGRRLQDVRESAHMDFYDMAKLAPRECRTLSKD